MIEYDTGELETKKEFPRWRWPVSNQSLLRKYFPLFCRRDINHLYQLLAYARKIFYQIDTMDPVNVEAGKL